MEEVPCQLIITWDHTAMKMVPAMSWTMEKKGTKRVEIAAIEDKRQITVLFGCTMAGDVLPLQLIYGGTTQKCLPKIRFPSDWHITCTANHWSNESTMIEYVKRIIIPYVTRKRQELGLTVDQSALAVFNFFKGQCTEEIFKPLDDNNILYVLVPANCTDRCQPLDLSVNNQQRIT